jgi:hypothetical protein
LDDVEDDVHLPDNSTELEVSSTDNPNMNPGEVHGKVAEVLERGRGIEKRWGGHY